MTTQGTSHYSQHFAGEQRENMKITSKDIGYDALAAMTMNIAIF
jgi:hypothetical protein